MHKYRLKILKDNWKADVENQQKILKENMSKWILLYNLS